MKTPKSSGYDDKYKKQSKPASDEDDREDSKGKKDYMYEYEYSDEKGVYGK